MNAKRRKEIERLYTKLEDIKADIENIRDEEEEAYDNLPESLLDGERGEKMQDAIANLENATTSIDDVLDYLNDATV